MESEIAGHDSPGDLPEPKDERPKLTPAQRQQACEREVRAACTRYQCAILPKVDFENIGESGARWLTEVRVQIQALAEVDPA